MGEETITETITAEYPQPAGAYVLLPNPLSGLVEELGEELEKMPEKDRREFATKHIAKLHEKLTIIAVGPEGRGFEAGDVVMIPNEVAAASLFICDEKYMLVRASNIVAKW